MLRSVNGNASNFGNKNSGVIAGGDVKIYNSLIDTDTTQSSQSHPTSQSSWFLFWGSTEYTPSPWEEWHLDETFFQSLSDYTKDHPEERLICITDRISAAMEESQDYLALIPGSPFPAETLMKALCCLLKLGVTVKRVKQVVFEFVRQVVEWIQVVKSAFEAPEHNHFTFLTWRNLRNTRDLINEICIWAQDRLEHHRWTQVRNGFRIGKEIDQFKACPAESKEIFKGISLLPLEGSMYSILAGIWYIFFHQDQILDEIQRIKKQKQDQLEYIIKEEQEMKSTRVRRLFLEKNLDKHTISEPGFSMQEKVPCEPGTRKVELAEIKQWLNSISSGSQNFLWLTGDPGCGKSAITASIAAHCRDEGILWAQFFINRNNEETTDPNTFFPTIARQLADFSPDVEHAIHDQLKVDPTLSDRVTSEQASKLLINALVVASDLDLGKAVAVIIDGLDETDRDRLYETADIFSRLFKSLTRRPNVKIFVSSRTDDHILTHFSQRGEGNIKNVHLDTAGSIDDVALFMRRQIEETIVKRYTLKWEEWPTNEGMKTLAGRASGLFLWAVTAVRYLQVKIEEDGRGCLRDVLTQLTGGAMGGINALYALILTSNQKKHATSLEWEFQLFRHIIGAIIMLKEPLCLDDLSALLNLCQGPSSTPVDIIHFVRRLRTVLVAGIDAVDGKTVPRLHKSFFDFITADTALFEQLSLDHRYSVDPTAAEGEIAICCIRLFANFRKEKENSLFQEGLHLKYALRFYLSHVDAVAKKSSMPTVALVTLGSTVEDVHHRLSVARQTGRLSPQFSFDSDRLASPFSPLTAAYPVTGDGQILVNAKSVVTSLAYSPDGERIVSGLDDGRLISWNAKRGIEIAELKGHTEQVNSVAISPSGDRFASGSDDKTAQIWNVATNQLVTIFHGHLGSVYSVAFSPVENVVASASSDRSICLWNSASGESIGSLLQHDQIVNSVTFSKDGNEIISGAEDGLVYLWNRKTGECRQKLESIISTVHSVAISSLGDQLLAIGFGGLCFWSRTDFGFIPDNQLTLELGYGSAAFSPDGKLVIVSDHSFKSRQFFVYDLSSRTKVPIHDNSFQKFALSPDGLSVVFSAHDKIHLSNIPRLLPVTLTSLSPDAEIVACVFSDGSVWVGPQNNLPVVRKKLDGNVGNVMHLTFSSNNSLLAAVDQSSIYLWDISSQKLYKSSSFNTLSHITTLSFLADRRTLTSTHEDRSMYAWHVVNGTLHPRAIDFSSSSITFDPQLLLDVDPDHAYEIAGARWFPAKSKDSGLWAYVDGALIRIRPDRTMTLLPLDSN